MTIKAKLFALLLLPAAQAGWALDALQLVADARSQIGKTLYYDPAYSALRYPMGDVPLLKGVCTDVVIRALPSAAVADFAALRAEVVRCLNRRAAA